MKIAVATDNGVSVSGHFGKSGHFLVFDVDGSEIKDREMRENTYTAHARGQCHRDGHEEGPHSHQPIVDALRDCAAVLCGGMGWRAAAELSAHGIQPFVIEDLCSVEEAVFSYLDGRATPGLTCHGNAGHSHEREPQS